MVSDNYGTLHHYSRTSHFRQDFWDFLSLGKVGPCYFSYRIELVWFKDTSLVWGVLVIQWKRLLAVSQKPVSSFKHSVRFVPGTSLFVHTSSSCVQIWTYWRCFWIVAIGLTYASFLFFKTLNFCVPYWNERSIFLPLPPNAEFEEILIPATQSKWCLWIHHCLTILKCIIVATLRLSWLLQLCTDYSSL